jgi:peroxiredoxin
MIELGELENHYQDFAKRNVRVVAISNDDQPLSQKTQEKFPHLRVVADTDQKLAKAVEVIHTGMGHDGKDTNAPTTILLDGTGTVRWVFRPDNFMTRLAPDELLAAIDTKKEVGDRR